jgi:hypothetical protein
MGHNVDVDLAKNLLRPGTGTLTLSKAFPGTVLDRDRTANESKSSQTRVCHLFTTGLPFIITSAPFERSKGAAIITE